MRFEWKKMRRLENGCFFVFLSLARRDFKVNRQPSNVPYLCMLVLIHYLLFFLSKLPLSCIIFHLMIIIYKDRFILCVRFIFLIFFLSLSFYREHLWLSLLRLTSPSLPVLSSHSLSSQMNTFKWQFFFLFISYVLFFRNDG